MAKGEIVCFEQFLLLPQFFQKSSAVEALESDCMWERVNKQSTLTSNDPQFYSASWQNNAFNCHFQIHTVIHSATI